MAKGLFIQVDMRRGAQVDTAFVPIEHGTLGARKTIKDDESGPWTIEHVYKGTILTSDQLADARDAHRFHRSMTDI